MRSQYALLFPGAANKGDTDDFDAAIRFAKLKGIQYGLLIRNQFVLTRMRQLSLKDGSCFRLVLEQSIEEIPYNWIRPAPSLQFHVASTYTQLATYQNVDRSVGGAIISSDSVIIAWWLSRPTLHGQSVEVIRSFLHVSAVELEQITDVKWFRDQRVCHCLRRY